MASVARTPPLRGSGAGSERHAESDRIDDDRDSDTWASRAQAHVRVASDALPVVRPRASSRLTPSVTAESTEPSGSSVSSSNAGTPSSLATTRASTSARKSRASTPRMSESRPRTRSGWVPTRRPWSRSTWASASWGFGLSMGCSALVAAEESLKDVASRAGASGGERAPHPSIDHVPGPSPRN